MNITVINGTEKHGVTYRLKEMFLTEFTKIKFFFCRMIQKSIHKSDPEYLDGKYWAEQGWLDGGKPWK